jgi:hydrogenase expression/formation protein HypE
MSSRDIRTIKIGHGSGGRLTHDLIHEVIGKHLSNKILDEYLDSAIIDIEGRIVFTTDSYVVKPLFFRGGDIGKLAVTGTINDLAVVGAKPLYLSLSLIIEEGLGMDDLERIIISIKETAIENDVKVVTGDTKVVERGSGGGLFINTAGIGIINGDFELRMDTIKPGDKILINGGIGEHGTAIICSRGLIEFEAEVVSDCAAIYKLVQELIDEGIRVKFMRDPTRGGLATTLVELGERIPYSILINESDIIIKEAVRSICEFVGYDPLYLANEGKLVVVVDEVDAKRALDIMRRNKLGEESCVIGEIIESEKAKVLMNTILGTKRIIDMMIEDQLPRIC